MGRGQEQTETVVVNIRLLNLNQKKLKNKLHFLEDKEGDIVDRKDGRQIRSMVLSNLLSNIRCQLR